MSAKYILYPKEIAAHSLYVCFSLCEVSCYSNRPVQNPSSKPKLWFNQQCFTRGKMTSPQVLKMDVMPNLQLSKVWEHFVWPVLIFKSWVLLSSYLNNFMLFSFLIQQWAPFCKGFCMLWRPMMSWQAQVTSYVWVFFSRSMVDMSLRSEQKVKESKTKKFNLESATYLSTRWENPYVFPFLSFSPLHVEKYYTSVLT